jgi:rRNA-processing protein FCF1
MRNELDIEIYKVLSEQINASEIYLGHTGCDFLFTKTNYEATFTEAFPLNPFDKVICEILQLEENLNFHELGSILGMNVGSSENRKVLKDSAEFEILMEALQSLSEFSMIEGGDIYFSRCRLTEIGKEYAAKKHKFRKTSNKRFTIYFDRTTGNHKHARANYEFANGQLVREDQGMPEINGFDLKEIAAVQIPEIYNPQKLFSYTDEVVYSSDDYCITYDVAATFDVHEGKYLFYCYDRSNKQVHGHFSKWIAEQETVKTVIIENLKVEIGEISNQSIDAYPTLKASLPTQKLSTSIKLIAGKDLLDQYFVLNYLKHFIQPAQKIDLYLCLPILSESLYGSVVDLIQASQQPDSRYFIVFPNAINASLNKGVQQLLSQAAGMRNLYIMQQEVKSFVFVVKMESDSFSIEFKDAVLDTISIDVAKRVAFDARAKTIENYLLSKFSTKFAFSLSSEATELMNCNMEIPVTKDELERLADTEFKLLPFSEIGEQAEIVKTTLELIGNFKEQRIKLLNVRISSSLEEIVTSIPEVNELKKLSQLRKELTELERQLIDAETVMQFAFDNAIVLLDKKRAEIEEQKRIYSFIIDTNILLEDPEVILRVDKKHSIIIPAKVLDELDKFKMDENLSAAVSRVVKLIQQDKNRNIRHNKGRPKLLPPDLNQKTPDNLILSVAIQYQNNHGVLVTSDSLLAVKAQNVLDLTVMNLQEFKTKFDQSLKS